MTSMAVTASICASTSDVALLVASFMPIPPRLGLPRLGRDSSLPAKARRSVFYSEHPTTSIRFDESPLSEYRLCQGRTAMRRHFGSPAAGLCAWDEIFEAIFRRDA